MGGSATNDAGIGIAKALEYSFLDAQGKELDPIGGNLSKIAKINTDKVAVALKDASFFAVNDVDNLLYGETGAAHVYAS